MTAPHPLMTTAEVAEAFRVDPKQPARWRRAGRIAWIRLPGGREVRYFRAEVDARLAGKPLTPAQVRVMREKLLDSAP